MAKALGHVWLNDSWYRPAEKVGDLWHLKCGACPIALASMPDVLSENRDYHKKLRSDPELAAVARDVAGESARMRTWGLFSTGCWKSSVTSNASQATVNSALRELSHLDHSEQLTNFPFEKNELIPAERRLSAFKFLSKDEESET